jgi:hypothetical protein
MLPEIRIFRRIKAPRKSAEASQRYAAQAIDEGNAELPEKPDSLKFWPLAFDHHVR